jgi:hypothetical protein
MALAFYLPFISTSHEVIWNGTERGAGLIMLDQEVDDKGLCRKSPFSFSPGFRRLYRRAVKEEPF